MICVILSHTVSGNSLPFAYSSRVISIILGKKKINYKIKSRFTCSMGDAVLMMKNTIIFLQTFYP